MNENIKLFLEKLSEDEEMQAKISQVRDPDEAYAIASSIQGGFTKEEFVEEMTRLKAAMDESLTDEDLAQAAGGMSDSAAMTISITAMTALSAASISATAAVSAGV